MPSTPACRLPAGESSTATDADIALILDQMVAIRSQHAKTNTKRDKRRLAAMMQDLAAAVTAAENSQQELRNRQKGLYEF